MGYRQRSDQDLLEVYIAHRRGFERLYEELLTAHRHAARLRAELEMDGALRRRTLAPRAAGHRRHTRPL